MHVGGEGTPESACTEASKRAGGCYGIGSNNQTQKGMVAVRFTPTQPGTLSKVSIFMWGKAGSPANLEVSLYSGDKTQTEGTQAPAVCCHPGRREPRVAQGMRGAAVGDRL